MLSGEVQIAQHVFLVEDGQLQVFIPGGEGGSEPVTWDTCRGLLVILQLCTIMAGNNRDQ